MYNNDDLAQLYYNWSNNFNDYYNQVDKWVENLNKVKSYINKNKKKPSRRDKDKTVRGLGHWILNQTKKYKNNTYIMKNSEIQYIWKGFIDNYSKYFTNRREKWYDNLTKVKLYIDKYKKRPSKYDNDRKVKKIGNWLSNQLNKNNKNLKYNNDWDEFINNYNKYFKSDKEGWYDKFNKLKWYINKYNKIPSQYDNTSYNRKIGYWLTIQSLNYTYKKKIMKIPEIYNEWKDFINKYKYYFNKKMNFR